MPHTRNLYEQLYDIVYQLAGVVNKLDILNAVEDAIEDAYRNYNNDVDEFLYIRMKGE